MLSYNLTSKFNAQANFDLPLVGVSFVNNIVECNDFSPNSEVQIVYIVSALTSVLIIALILVIVYLVRKLALKEKIILKL